MGSTASVLANPPDSINSIKQLLCGDISNFPNISKIIPKTQLSVFVSSTFTDTQRERNILHERILPKLQKKYQHQ